MELLRLCSAIHVATELPVAAAFHLSARDKPQPLGEAKPPVYFHLLLSPGDGIGKVLALKDFYVLVGGGRQ